MKKIITITLVLISTFSKAQWTTMNTTPTVQENKFCFVTDDIGYAVVTDLQNQKKINKTTNGGSTWDTITTPSTGTPIRTYHFPKDSLGFTVYNNSNNTLPPKVYMTVNDGITWSDITPGLTNTSYGSVNIQFIDENVGFMTVGDLLYRTLNAGNSWDTTRLAISSLGTYNAESIHFYDANNGVIGTSDGTFMYHGSMFVTTDGGQTFNRKDLNFYNSRISVVKQTSANTSYAVNFEYWSNSMNLYKSINNGITWDSLQINIGNTNTYLQNVDFIDALNGFAVTVSSNSNLTSYIYKTSDGGLTWQFNDSLSIGNPLDIELTANSGYLSGDSKQFAKYNAGTVNVEVLLEKKENSLSVYPNPIVSGTQLNWNSDIIYDQLIIKDITGKDVFNSAISTNNTNIPNLNTGVYFVQFINKESTKTVPLTIK